MRIELEDGVIQKIEAINVCDDLACQNNKCIETNEIWMGQTVEESVSSFLDLIILLELLLVWLRLWKL